MRNSLHPRYKTGSIYAVQTNKDSIVRLISSLHAADCILTQDMQDCQLKSSCMHLPLLDVYKFLSCTCVPNLKNDTKYFKFPKLCLNNRQYRNSVF
jgi:hypothetical protein